MVCPRARPKEANVALQCGGLCNVTQSQVLSHTVLALQPLAPQMQMDILPQSVIRDFQICKAHLARAFYNTRHDEDAYQGCAHAAEPKDERKLCVQQVREAERQRGG